MKQKYKVLWVEDGAMADLPELAVPVMMDGNYELIVAEDISDAIYKLGQNEYDVIIVDIRMDPGELHEWWQLYHDAGSNKTSARLGRQFLYTILGNAKAEVKIQGKPIHPSRIGVLTAESELELAKDLKILNISPSVFRQKRADAPRTILLELINKVVAQSKVYQAHKEANDNAKPD